MIYTPHDSLVSSFKSFARGAGLSAVLIGTVSVLLRIFSIDVFYSLLRIFGIVQISTAVSFILAGIAIFLLNRERISSGNLRLAILCTCMFFLITVFSISGYLHTGSLFLQRNAVLSSTGAETVRMAPTTAIYFLFLSFAFFFLRSGGFSFTSQILSFIGIFIGILNLMGHTYGVPALLSIGNYPQTDLLSTMLFILLISAALVSNPDKHIMAVISSPYIGGVIARKLLPIAITIPFLLGWLRLAGQRAGIYGLETGVVITGLFTILIFTIIICILSNSLNHIDAKRKKAEDFSEATNEKLLKMVESLEEDGKKNALIAEMKDILQTCTGVPETAPVIRRFVEHLLPSQKGALFLFSPSRNDLESLACWGTFSNNTEELLFLSEECWALRRGRPYVVQNPGDEIICPHVKATPPPVYCCMPLTAYGEVLGVLHLRDIKSAASKGKLTDPSVQKTVAAIAEHLAISLANLKLREILKNQSIRDPLTGLFNRRYMEETLQREISRAARKKSLIGIIMVDIDHFKNFNDIYGHSAGDELLIQLGKFLQSNIRTSDVACRYGGEEFTLFMPDVPAEELFKRADALRTGVKTLNVTAQGKLLKNITISLGISIYPKHGSSPETLLKAADNALYRAKKEGRDRAVMEE